MRIEFAIQHPNSSENTSGSRVASGLAGRTALHGQHLQLRRAPGQPGTGLEQKSRHSPKTAELYLPTQQSHRPPDSAPRAIEQTANCMQATDRERRKRLPPATTASDKEGCFLRPSTEAQDNSPEILVFSQMHFSVCQSQASHHSVVDDCQWTTRRALFVSEI